MTDERTRPRTDAAGLAEPVTGVARGNLGTGTALDDTQEYDVNTFAADGGAEKREPPEQEPPEPEHSPVDVPEPESEPAPPMLAPGHEPDGVTPPPIVAASGPATTPTVSAAPPPPSPVAVHVVDQPVVRPRQSRRPAPADRAPLPRLVGILAAVFVVLLVAFAVVELGDGAPAAGGLPALGTGPTATTPADEASAKPDGGKGKGKCNGNGNGRGDNCDEDGGGRD